MRPLREVVIEETYTVRRMYKVPSDSLVFSEYTQGQELVELTRQDQVSKEVLRDKRLIREEVIEFGTT